MGLVSVNFSSWQRLVGVNASNKKWVVGVNCDQVAGCGCGAWTAWQTRLWGTNRLGGFNCGAWTLYDLGIRPSYEVQALYGPGYEPHVGYEPRETPDCGARSACEARLRGANTTRPSENHVRDPAMRGPVAGCGARTTCEALSGAKTACGTQMRQRTPCETQLRQRTTCKAGLRSTNIWSIWRCWWEKVSRSSGWDF